MIFVSYCREDRELVLPFVEAFKRRGVEFWLDELNILPGDDLTATIERGLRGCSGAIIFLSKTYLEKAWTRAELRYFTSRAIRDESLRLVVVRIGNSNVPPLLESLAHISPSDFERIAEFYSSDLPTTSAATTTRQTLCVPEFLGRLADAAILSLAGMIISSRDPRSATIALPFRTKDSGDVTVYLMPSLPEISIDCLEAACIRHRNYQYHCDSLHSQITEGGLGVFTSAFELRLARRMQDAAKAMTEVSKIVEDLVLEIARSN